MGKETKAGSRSYFQQDYSARTKLKFRQPGQTSASDVEKRDLRAELLRSEREALNRKRKAQGLEPLAPAASDLLLTNTSETGKEDATEEDPAAKRRRILEEAAKLDADDDSDDEQPSTVANGKGKERAQDEQQNDQDENESDSDEDSDDDDSDEDDTAALMAELAKIKQERAEEKARLDAETSESNRVDREAEIAMGNPLLNLEAALGQGSSTAGSDAGGSFTVKRRWDDDLIFKNQAAGQDDKPKKEFVNDILRSEFHRESTRHRCAIVF